MRSQSHGSLYPPEDRYRLLLCVPDCTRVLAGLALHPWRYSAVLVRHGLLGDPCQVFRVAVGDGPGRHTWYFVRVFLLGNGNDLCYPVAPRVERCPSFGALADVPAPSVNRPDGREVMRAGTQSQFYQL